jgi:hypothetical protein
MGAGNWLPSHHNQRHYEVIYVEYPEYHEEHDYLWEEWNDQLENDILDALPESFWHEDRWHGTDYVLASNQLLHIIMGDNNWSRAIAVATIYDDYTIQMQGLGAMHIPKVSKRIIDHLGGLCYNLSRRTGPWTSAKLEA